MARSRKSSRPATRAGGRRSWIACGARSLLLRGTAIRSAASSPRISSGAARSSRVARDAVCSSQPRWCRCCASCADARAPTSVALAYHLVDHSVPDDRTLFEGIRRVGGGRHLELSPSGQVQRRHWAPRYHAPLQGSRADLAEQLHETLSAAIDAALSLRSVAAMLLSGGLDSSVVAALASRRSAPWRPSRPASPTTRSSTRRRGQARSPITSASASPPCRSSVESRSRPPRGTWTRGSCLCPSRASSSTSSSLATARSHGARWSSMVRVATSSSARPIF